MPARPAIVDGWYADLIPALRRPPAWWPARSAVRGLLLAVASVRGQRVALIRHDPGWRVLLALRALFGRRRKLLALHFIEPRPVRGLRGRADRWATRRAVAVGQTLTADEQTALARRYGLPPERFPVVPFALRSGAALPPAADGRTVVAAGRAECDWATLLAAAEGADWRLTVVCSAADEPAVRRLGGERLAELRVERPREETRALLRGAAVAVIAMRESGAAQGHVRLMEAVDAGAAVVATDVAALRGYAEDGETALLVDPHDADGLRRAVDRLLGDPAERQRLRTTAFARAQRWTWADYLAAVERLVLTGAPARSP
jgi:glycosyltransferase involved in cell wall biosynthesis